MDRLGGPGGGCRPQQRRVLEGAGRGVTVIKVADDDLVIGFIAGRKADTLTIETDKSGKKFELKADPKEVSSRGGKGHQLMKRVSFRVVEEPVKIQPLANA